MVYKKYIERNGKLYGPYLYNSRRVDGKVISEYQGTEKKDYKKFIFLSLGILLLIFSVFFIINTKGKLSGNVVSNSGSEIKIENVQEKVLIYPKIYFTLVSTKIQKEEPIVEEILPVNSSLEEQVENQLASGNLTISGGEDIPENYSEIISGENFTNSEEEILIPEEEIIENTESLSIQEIPEESTNPKIQTEESPGTNIISITGGVVSQILKSVSNFFLGFLRPTGMVVSDYSSTKINAETTADNSFTYNMEEGEIIELFSGSVRTDSKNLPDNTLILSFEGNVVLVKTNYSEIVNLNNSESVEINSSVNKTKPIEQKDFNVIELDEEEKQILFAEFGNFSIEPTKYELFHGRYIVRYDLGKYNIEYSYDSGLENKTLEWQIEKDKVKWFRDLIAKVSVFAD